MLEECPVTVLEIKPEVHACRRNRLGNGRKAPDLPSGGIVAADLFPRPVRCDPAGMCQERDLLNRPDLASRPHYAGRGRGTSSALPPLVSGASPGLRLSMARVPQRKAL
jgi:hypothetical protein